VICVCVVVDSSARRPSAGNTKDRSSSARGSGKADVPSQQEKSQPAAKPRKVTCEEKLKVSM